MQHHMLTVSGFLFATLVVATPDARGQPICGDVPVTTHHLNPQRTGANTDEKSLDHAKVASGNFGKLWEYPVRGDIYAQPLLARITINPAQGSVCAVFVATAENFVYAFNANNFDPKPFWVYDAGAENVALAGRVYLQDDGTSAAQNITPTVGIIGTPVIDLAHLTMYFVAMTQDGDSRFTHTLHAIDIRTGVLRQKTTISGDIAGGGQFNSQRENQRAALAIAKDKIYVAWASFGDIQPFDGLVMSYALVDSPTPLKKLQQFQVASFDPLIGRRHKGGGIWHSGGGPAIDPEEDFLYVVTGNGDSSNSHAGRDFDSSTVKLNTDLRPVDYYTPSYQNFLNEHDLDLSVAGPMIPEDQLDSNGRPVKLLIHGSKAGIVYVLNRDNLGKFHEDSNNVIQQLQVFSNADDLDHQLAPTHIHSVPVYWRAPDGPRVYVASDFNLGVRAFRFDHEKLATRPVASNFFPRAPITEITLSSDGSKPGTGILWCISSPTGTIASYPGILYAFNAETLDLLYSSEENPFDRLGDYPRFGVPIVSVGRVYVPTFSNKLVVYGMCPFGNDPRCRTRSSQ
jgi:hypothetical protein